VPIVRTTAGRVEVVENGMHRWYLPTSNVIHADAGTDAIAVVTADGRVEVFDGQSLMHRGYLTASSAQRVQMSSDEIVVTGGDGRGQRFGAGNLIHLGFI
jgi:hypothetical protein